MIVMHNLFEKANKQPVKVTSNPTQLSLTEIEVILNILKDSSFKIRDIEILYKALIKLQEQHQELSK